MTQKNPSPKRTNKQQYSVGSLAVMLLLVLAYWWITGSLPGSEDSSGSEPVANDICRSLHHHKMYSDFQHIHGFDMIAIINLQRTIRQ